MHHAPRSRTAKVVGSARDVQRFFSPSFRGVQFIGKRRDKGAVGLKLGYDVRDRSRPSYPGIVPKRDGADTKSKFTSARLAPPEVDRGFYLTLARQFSPRRDGFSDSSNRFPTSCPRNRVKPNSRPPLLRVPTPPPLQRDSCLQLSRSNRGTDANHSADVSNQDYASGLLVSGALVPKHCEFGHARSNSLWCTDHDQPRTATCHGRTLTVVDQQVLLTRAAVKHHLPGF